MYKKLIGKVTRISAALVLSSSFLVACGGGGGGSDDKDPGPPADPTGYYTNTGTATVDGVATPVDDLQAMVSGNRIMMMSVAEGLLYDGTINNITGNDFTADFTVYTHGENPITAEVSGTITEGSSITGTLTGSGVGSGTFSLLYDVTASSTAADLARIENEPGVHSFWEGRIGGAIIGQRFSIDIGGGITHDSITIENIFYYCNINGSITPIENSSMYSVDVVLSACRDAKEPNGTYTGLATSRSDSSTDDILVFAVTNDSFAPHADYE